MVKKTIQLILNTNIKHLGITGDIIHVKPGYARNYLLPTEIASPVTPGRLNYFKKVQQEKIQIQKEKVKNFNKIKKQLETISKFSIKKKTSDNNTIFGSVSEKEIIQIINRQTGCTLEKNQIEIPMIKNLGVYRLNINLFDKIQTTIQLQVLPEIL